MIGVDFNTPNVEESTYFFNLELQSNVTKYFVLQFASF